MRTVGIPSRFLCSISSFFLFFFSYFESHEPRCGQINKLCEKIDDEKQRGPIPNERQTRLFIVLRYENKR